MDDNHLPKHRWQLYRPWPWARLPAAGIDGLPLGKDIVRRFVMGAWQYRNASEADIRSEILRTTGTAF